MEHEVDENLKKEALGGSLWNLVSQITQRLGALVFTVLIARILLPEGFGIYNLAISVVMLVMILGRKGVDQTIIRYLSEFSKNKRKQNSYFKYILKFKFLILTISALILLFVTYPLSFYFFKKPELFLPLIFATCYIYILSIEGFFTSLFIAEKKVQYLAQRELFYQIARISILLIMIFFVSRSINVLHVISSLILSSILIFIIVFFRVRKLSPGLFKKAKKMKTKDRKRVINFLTYSSLASISLVFFGNIDTIMLGFLIDQAEYVGFYQAAFVLASSLAGLLGFAPVLLPIFVQLNKNELSNTFNKSIRYSLLLAIPAAFGLVALARHFLFLIYGEEYLQADVVLYILSGIVVLGIYSNLIMSLFLKEEKTKDYFYVMIFVLIINVILNYGLIKYLLRYSVELSVTGAAIATVSSYTIYSLILTYLLKKKTRIYPNLKFIWKPIIASIIMLIVINYLKISFNDINVISGILLITTGVFVYILGILILKGITLDELKTFRKGEDLKS